MHQTTILKENADCTYNLVVDDRVNGVLILGLMVISIFLIGLGGFMAMSSDSHDMGF